MRSYFSRRQKPLAVFAILYLLLLVFSHWQLPSIYVWYIAAFFSIAMNFTYLIESVSLEKSVRVEALVAGALIAFSLLGLVVSPLLLIAAIFGHGCWDLAKHFGSGVPFYYWYTCSCFLVDCAYSLALLLYFISL